MHVLLVGKGKRRRQNTWWGLAIKTSLCRQLPDLPTPVSERFMKLRFPLNPSRHVAVISSYTLTLTSSDEAKAAFNLELNAFVKGVLPSIKFILLEDFNAIVGTDCNNWNGVLGPHGTGKLILNGLMLLSFCAENDLTITNTLFLQAQMYKTTRMHPRSKQWYLTDYAICPRRDIRDVTITRAMRGAECWTDHRLVRSILSMHITPTRRKNTKSCRPALTPQN